MAKQNSTRPRRRIGACLVFLGSMSACSGKEDAIGQPIAELKPCVPDQSGAVPAREKPGQWQRVDLPGAICSNGSPYAIFVNYSASSNNLLVELEPGGACWDYGSCSPNGGLRGAANPNGLADGVAHMARFQFLPLLRPDAETNPVHDWNKVFIPYCTGDIHTGNNVITYVGPNGEELVFHHNGHANILKSIEWLNRTFTEVPQLLVSGCSAGGVGALINYHYIREGMTGAQCGYLLNDSGPIFPSRSNSGPLYQKVRQSWNLDPLIDGLKGKLQGITPEQLKQDFGLINTELADQYRQDRLSLSVYRQDLNYSLYSYESFFGYPPYTEIHRLWEEDLAALRQLYESRDNLGYFIANFRIDNCSHCMSIPPIGLDGSDSIKALATPWLGSEIQESSITLRDYVVHLLDDSVPLERYFESEQPGEGFTPEQAAVCEDL